MDPPIGGSRTAREGDVEEGCGCKFGEGEDPRGYEGGSDPDKRGFIIARRGERWKLDRASVRSPPNGSVRLSRSLGSGLSLQALGKRLPAR